MTSHHHHSRGHRRSEGPRRRHPERIALLAFAIGVIALLTLRPGELNQPTQTCLICAGQTADALLNILLFVPLGVALSTLGVGARRAVAIGAAASVAIEMIQLFALEGRFATAVDVVANTIGAGVGVGVAIHRDRILYPRSERALRLAVGGGVTWLVILLLSAVGLRHAFPPGGYVVQWAPLLSGQPRFAGRISSMTISDLPVGDAPVHDSATLRDATRSGVNVVVIARAGQPTRGEAPIARLVAARRERELVYLARRESHLVVRTRVLASTVGMRAPTLVVPGAFLGWDRATEIPVPITAERRRDILRASVGGEAASLSIHPALGWTMLLPFDTDLVTREIAVSAAWTALPLVAVGYWIGRRARRRARRSGRERGWTSTRGELAMAAPFIALLLIVGLGGVAILFGQRVPPAEVWVAGVAGVIVGVSVGVRFALRHSDHAHRRDPGSDPIAPPPAAMASR